MVFVEWVRRREDSLDSGISPEVIQNKPRIGQELVSSVIEEKIDRE